jgi:preprotein translocase subunit SecG
MAFLYYVIITVHVFTCLFLIGVVLLQQGKGQDLASAFGGGGSQTAFGPRGSATVLSRATTILAALFMVTSFSLSVIKSGRSTVLDQINATTTTEKPAAATEEPAGSTEAPAEPAQAPAPPEDSAGEPAEAPASE